MDNFKRSSSVVSLEILDIKNKPFDELLGFCLNNGLISDKTSRLFGVWCYRDTLNWIKDPLPESINAANVAEKYALGQASQNDLSAAESAARSAARSAAWSAAESAAWSAASAAWSAASAARSAASAAESAAWSAASAAWSAASAARSAAWSAARSAADDRQKQELIHIIKEELRIV